jgi:hypothetical protein
VGHSDGKKTDLKRRISHEIQAYLFNVAFLLVFFLSFTTYRALVLAEYHVGVVEYSFAIVQSLILAKVILIGDAFGMGRRFEDAPLILSALYKSLLFGLLVVAFSTLEHVVRSWVHHRPLGEELSFAGPAGLEKLARLQLMFVAFLPFFAFREIGRVIGEKRLLDLFFRGEKGAGGEGDGAE